MLVFITFGHKNKKLLKLEKYFRKLNLTLYPTIYFTDEEIEAQSLIQQRYQITRPQPEHRSSNTSPSPHGYLLPLITNGGII